MYINRDACASKFVGKFVGKFVRAAYTFLFAALFYLHALVTRQLYHPLIRLLYLDKCDAPVDTQDTYVCTCTHVGSSETPLVTARRAGARDVINVLMKFLKKK